eukprot:COSAG01_NODE_55477_length_324_cov_7.075556_1_plen_107_part_11
MRRGLYDAAITAFSKSGDQKLEHSARGHEICSRLDEKRRRGASPEELEHQMKEAAFSFLQSEGAWTDGDRPDLFLAEWLLCRLEVSAVSFQQGADWSSCIFLRTQEI